jgi:hypothetical protein
MAGEAAAREYEAGPRLSLEDLATLPPTVDPMTAAQTLGIGRTAAYALVRAGRWPTPVVRAGRLIRVPAAPLLDLLGIVTHDRDRRPPLSAVKNDDAGLVERRPRWAPVSTRRRGDDVDGLPGDIGDAGEVTICREDGEPVRCGRGGDHQVDGPC